ncbi:hypothetical protein [Bordetella sp. LUAb4]|uniref:hypothetical protein n=1 Tax=Bordetella sp. LUAb4 TaxID=2843195 RepID=UPI001E3AF704|nr:hypothetical protein [Bordetella sp. LUAb4]
MHTENKQLQAENEQLQARINDLERRIEQLSMGATAHAPRADIDRSTDLDATENRTIYPADGKSTISGSSENSRAAKPVRVHANFSEERDGTHLIIDSKKLFVINSDSRSVCKLEWLLRMMKCDSMEDKKEIRQLLDLPPYLPTTKNIVQHIPMLVNGNPYGTVECLHDIRNLEQENPRILNKNRAAEKKLLPEMQRYLAKGRYDYFLFLRGKNGRDMMLVNAVNERAGTMTSRSFPSAVCETGSPFLKSWDFIRKMGEDLHEDWMLFGIKTHPEIAPTPRAS